MSEQGLALIARLAGLEEKWQAAEAYTGPLTDCVYYWLRGDLIKIGQTRNLPPRLKALRPGELLAVEPGTRDIEQGRHRQFADSHEPCEWGTEWFRPSPLLVWHIEAMAKLYPISLLEELPQLRVPMKQRRPRTLKDFPEEMEARRRMAKWVEMLPQIIAEVDAEGVSA